MDIEIPKLQRVGVAMENMPKEPEFIVDGMLPASGMSILVAHPKAGKSTLVRNLAMCVARGDDFLGRKTRKGPVLYYALEDIPGEAVNDFRHMGATLEDEVYLRLGPIFHDYVKAVMREDIEALDAALVIADPLFDAVAIEDANSYGPVNRAMKELLAVARNHDCHVLTCHHTNKAHRGGGLAILGSQALRGSTDCNIFLYKTKEGPRLIETENRGSGRPFVLTTLEWNEYTKRITVGRNAFEERQDTIKEMLVIELAKTRRISTSKLYKKIKARAEDKGPALHALLTEGRVKCWKEGRTTYWRLRSEE